MGVRGIVTVFVLVLAGCPAEDFSRPCVRNDECAGSSLCIDGACVIAACNPAVEAVCDGVDDPRGCCRAIDNCDPETLTCARDPAIVGTGCVDVVAPCVPCIESGDCAFDALCAGGRCTAIGDRAVCDDDSNCDGAHCDAFANVCIDDDCNRCAEFPDLCCGDGEVCDSVSSVCVSDVPVCTPNSDAGCGPGLVCDALGHCVACRDNDDCGFGTHCGVDHRCVGNSDCAADADCAVFNPDFRCVEARCIAPACLDDAGCGDARAHCLQFACVLDPPVCSETDEPNNVDATVVGDLIDVDYQSTICRGDIDLVAFPVADHTLYVIDVEAEPFVSVTLGGVATGFTSTRFVAQNDGGSGVFTLTVETVDNIEVADLSTYRIAVDARPGIDDCVAETGDEVNDTEATAQPLALGTAAAFTRCGEDDLDYFVVSDLRRGEPFTALLDGYDNDVGNLDLVVLEGPLPASVLASSETDLPTESVSTQTTLEPLLVLVRLRAFGFPSPLGRQPYRLLVTQP